MTHHEMIEVIAAAAAGKTIQHRYHYLVGIDDEIGWEDREKPRWNFGMYDYRVKPEPPPLMDRWINVYSGLTIGVYPTRELADTSAGSNRTACVHLREIREDV